MYILIAGNHPLHKKGESIDNYVEQLKDITWSFPNEFSELAREFFAKLVKVDPLERYTAKEALNHPWITRVVGPIPLSYSEDISFNNSKAKLINVLFDF